MSRLLGMVGLCARAGKLKSGESACEQLLKSGDALLLLMDEEISPRGEKQLADACVYAGVELVRVPGGKLGAAIGKPGRMAACVVDPGFADRIKALAAQQIH